ncbi:ARM repeat-containing protein [Anaeromyces robustus]|uniref:ARM repeat-containing protein n=1 Tax=Anaeromyces robustus TaxID=1754192 RepID=A0A1Y1XI58_9FUNG|nr:ARM repeat-containing protein [Anaeromyces robustus]|eukprot:ORX85382.1 ARM repeat-containing protein [Anaeromyces robustus]
MEEETTFGDSFKTVNEQNIEEDEDSLKQISSFFPFDTVNQLLIKIINSYDIQEGNSFNIEDRIVNATFGQIRNIIINYLEQPYLLDSYLERLILPVIEKIRNDIKIIFQSDNQIELLNNYQNRNYLYKYLYLLTNVRGYKTILKFFSHEVSDLESTINFLILNINNSQCSCWETKYILLIWLSLIFMIPFDIKNVDSSGDNEESMIQKVMRISKEQMGSAGKEQEGAALLISRILLRKDLHKTELPNYINWSVEQLSITDSIFLRKGILLSLCTIFKQGLRDYILPLANDTLPIIHLFEDEKFNSNSLLKKLLIKLTQRIGLCFLKPKIAKWRYKRGNRFLSDNLSLNSNNINNDNDNDDNDDEEEEEEEIPECLEEIIEILLSGLKDKATIVRWSSAKGIGRLTQRLSKDLAADIIECVINLFSENTLTSGDNKESIERVDISTVSDDTWHGACLALAELARRGLLLPNRLPIIIPWTIKALTFEQQKGSFSVGSNVRDAACYVCWSFARAYDPKIMKPYVNDMAKALVSLSVFDRELNVRRASSAAFQENVGRQGLFPHGIDIITKADYFTVGNRNECFRTISCDIANYEEYRYSMINHLISYSVVHWDQVIRELAAESLGTICKMDIPYTEANVIPKLIEIANSTELNERHGAVVALGEVCYKCYIDVSKSSDEWWTQEQLNNIIKPISNILPQYSTLYLTSFGSEIALQGICFFITKLSEIKWKKEETKRWEELLLLSLERKEIIIQELAIEGIKQYYDKYPINDDQIKNFISKLDFSMDPIIRSGYSRALSVLPHDILVKNNDIIFNAITKICIYEENGTNNDVESRKYAIQALTNFALNSNISNEQYNITMDLLFDGMKDYSIDNRGDIGSVVREQCMKSFEVIVPFGITKNFINDSSIYINVINELLQQCVEKINRIRVVACKVLISLIWENDQKIPNNIIPNIELLEKAFKNGNVDFKYINTNDLYNRLIPLIIIPEFRTSILTGLVVSVGGITESLVRDSSTPLLKFISELPKNNMTINDFLDSLLTIFSNYINDDRVTIPLLMVLELLLSSNSFEKLEDQEYFVKIFENIKRVIFKSKNVKKLVPAIKTICGLLSQNISEELKHNIMQRLLSYLVHPFPRIRKLTAEQFYLALLNIENKKISLEFNENDLEFNDNDDDDDDFEFDDEDENIEQVKNVLLQTDWNMSVLQIKPIRNSLYSLLNVSPPKTVKIN